MGSSDLYAAKRRNLLKNELSNDYYVPVSILVPAHNEEVTIEATVRSLLALDYKLYEIIVVDDGSTDDTAQVRAGRLPHVARSTAPSSAGSPASRWRRSMKPGRGRCPLPWCARKTAARRTP